jgi:hypothetical protein
MDNSHVALVTVQLEANEFDSYRCDRNMPLGVNVGPYYAQSVLILTFSSARILDQDPALCQGQ